MRDAKVVCQCPEIRIPDLGLHLQQGQSVWVDADKVKGSKDLDHARRIQAIRIEWKERAMSHKIMTSTKKITVTLPSEPLLPVSNPAVVPNQNEEIRKIVAEEVAKAIAGLEERLVKCMQQGSDSKPRRKKETT